MCRSPAATRTTDQSVESQYKIVNIVNPRTHFHVRTHCLSFAPPVGRRGHTRRLSLPRPHTSFPTLRTPHPLYRLCLFCPSPLATISWLFRCAVRVMRGWGQWSGVCQLLGVCWGAQCFCGARHTTALSCVSRGRSACGRHYYIGSFSFSVQLDESRRWIQQNSTVTDHCI